MARSYTLGAFPFPLDRVSAVETLDDYALGNPYGGPFGYSLNEAVRLFWRVKTWHVRFEVTVVVPSGSDLPPYTFVVILEGDVSQGGDESTLVLWPRFPQNQYYFVPERASYTGTLDGQPINLASASIGFSLWANGGVSDTSNGKGCGYVRTSGGLIYPRFAAYANFATGDFTEIDPSDGYAYLAPTYTGGSIVGSNPGGTSGCSLALRLDGRDTTAGFAASSGVPSGAQLTITPKKYWEYRDQSGANPLYDADSGARLG